MTTELNKINQKIDKLTEPIYNYIHKFKVPVKSITIDNDYYDQLEILLQEKQWWEHILFNKESYQLPKHIVFVGPHGYVDIKRKNND